MLKTREDETAQGLKRLIAFGGLKIDNIEVVNSNIRIHFTRKGKKFYADIFGGSIMLYDKDDNLIITVIPENDNPYYTTNTTPKVQPKKWVKPYIDWTEYRTLIDNNTSSDLWINPITTVDNNLWR